jgi:hypothetical protein
LRIIRQWKEWQTLRDISIDEIDRTTAADDIAMGHNVVLFTLLSNFIHDAGIIPNRTRHVEVE